MTCIYTFFVRCAPINRNGIVHHFSSSTFHRTRNADRRAVQEQHQMHRTSNSIIVHVGICFFSEYTYLCRFIRPLCVHVDDHGHLPTLPIPLRAGYLYRNGTHVDSGFAPGFVFLRLSVFDCIVPFPVVPPRPSPVSCMDSVTVLGPACGGLGRRANCAPSLMAHSLTHVSLRSPSLADK